MDFKRLLSTLGVARMPRRRTSSRRFEAGAHSTIPTSIQVTDRPETRFKEINEAYEVLGDPEKRKKYDSWAPTGGCTNSRRSGGAGFDPRQAARRLERQLRPARPRQSGYRTMTQEEMNEMFGGENPFSDFFQTFFGACTRRSHVVAPAPRTSRARAGRDVEQSWSSPWRTRTTARRGASRSSTRPDP